MPSQAVEPYPSHAAMMRDAERIKREARAVLVWTACCGTAVLMILLWRLIGDGTLYGQSLLAVVLLYGMAGALYRRKRQIDRDLAALAQRLVDEERLRHALLQRREEEL